MFIFHPVRRSENRIIIQRESLPRNQALAIAWWRVYIHSRWRSTSSADCFARGGTNTYHPRLRLCNLPVLPAISPPHSCTLLRFEGKKKSRHKMSSRRLNTKHRRAQPTFPICRFIHIKYVISLCAAVSLVRATFNSFTRS